MRNRAIPYSIVVFVLAAGLVSTSVLADDAAAAKAKFQIGVEMFQKENYPAALKAFEDSYRLNAVNFVLYNIGMCEKALFRFVDAIDTFERYLKGENVPREKRRKAEAAIKEMRGLVGSLTVENAPAGCDVLVDGEKTATTPLEKPVSVDPGDHTVHVVKDGFDTFDTKIFVESGATVSVNASLEPLVAKLIIDCREEDAVIKVDGEVVGGCPTVGDVSAGMHEITVSSPSSRQYSRTVEVGPGGEMTVSVALEPVSEGPPKTTVPKSLLPEGPASDDSAPETPAPKRENGLLIAGIASLTAGVGMGIVGAVFTAKGGQDVDRGDGLWEDMLEARRTGDQTAFDESRADYIAIKDEDIPRHRAVMIAGYATGGALTALGAALLAVGLRDRSESAAVSLSPAGVGIQGRF